MSKIHAFIDESGQRGRNGSRHFALSALVVREEKIPHAEELLAELKERLNRKPEHVLHWVKYTSHSHRLEASRTLGEAQSLLRAFTVVVCKDHLQAGSHMNDDRAYRYTFRFLLERLSWFAQQVDGELSYTLGHVRRFPLEKLRQYESNLRSNPGSINWGHLDASGGRIDQPSRVPLLQLADVVASAAGAAFNEDEYGFTETRYLENIKPILHVPPRGDLTKYGLKMHPWNDSTKAAYPWVAAL